MSLDKSTGLTLDHDARIVLTGERPSRRIMAVLNHWFHNQCLHIDNTNPKLMRVVKEQYDFARESLARHDPTD